MTESRNGSKLGKEWQDFDIERAKARARELLRSLDLTREIVESVVLRVCGPPPSRIEDVSLMRRIGYWRGVLYSPRAPQKVRDEARRILERLGATP